ncbi:MarR family winged helix-turn-helix transcriptional regulator [Actinospica sp.]|uniref:MarR family winged helix-turn-helix transcriptional regulator n=1 Tax=Actinospica sp. TaxID=1872142 RepID=UPI002C519CB4|nr:MarR family winged helix-turn-helix transcriptional regulator [Actinospica sp.]HWG26671.1 MarR family winged helix-turn-helix transcriptional regulator [Actinospica sp.]
MPELVPLSPDEEVLWRAMIRVMTTLPRALDHDLLHSAGLALHEYAVLLNLSETENREMRMTELAAAVALSPSRMTRLVDDLRVRGLVTKFRDAQDGRGSIARLTDKGLARLEAAYPDHLASVRNRVLDHLSPALVKRLGPEFVRVAENLGT